MQRRIVAVTVVALVAAMLVGCGGGKYASPEATMETMRAAAKAGDKDAVMACFCEDTRAKLQKMQTMAEDFAKENPELADKVDPDKQTQQMMDKAKTAKVEYGEETIDGDTATLVVITDGKQDTANFVREKGAWKLKLPITDQQIEMMKKGMEMMKNMPKGMMEGLKGLGEQMKKDMEKK
ncbi:MAG: hypothetical protein ACODAJ_01855 [Planctomycetota bacterium]